MENAKLLTGLVVIVLLLSVVNLYQNLSINSNVKMLSAKIMEPLENNNLPEQPVKIEVSADDDSVKGNKDAPITIIEFSDFQCPFCGKFFTDTLPELEEKYIKTGKAKLVYRDFPLEFHPFAQKAAEASECAHEQDKYWEYHNKLFENQNALDINSLKQYAKDLSLNTAKFNDCLDSGKMSAEVQKDFADGRKYGVSGTPTFYVNGIQLVGAHPFETFDALIKQQLQ